MFAGRCASMDAASWASARVMPQCMSMGEAAGTAAELALLGGVSPAEVDTQKLRAILLEQGAVLTMEQVCSLPVNEEE